MSWTDVFPVFTEEMVDEFHEHATAADKALLEEWYGVERVLNPLPHLTEIVTMSLFWKNVHAGDPELPVPTRERLQNAVELGLAERFNPWDHYVRPLLELTPELREKFPDTAIRVYLAKDLEFLAEELLEAGCEIYLMKSSSINFAPGGLWRFLPFEEEGKTIIVTDIDRLNELESDMTRTRAMAQAGVGAWRVPVPLDLNNGHEVSYLPFTGCQFGIQGGLLNVRELLDAFTWCVREERLDTNVIYPDCGPLPLQGTTWPSYGFDEYFMTVVAYPRVAQDGLLTFVPSGASSQFLTLDIEYCTWGNSASELVYFSTGTCCGGTAQTGPQQEAPAEGDRIEFPLPDQEEEFSEKIPAPSEKIASPPKVAFLFLTRGDINQPLVWRDYFNSTLGRTCIFAHVKEPKELSEDSILKDHLIAERVETTWADISLVSATLSLLRAGLRESDATHFMLVSESCVPVRPFEDLSYSLQLDPRSRMRYESWAEMRKRDIVKAQRLEKLQNIRKELAFFQQQWMLLTREDALCVTKTDHTSAFAETFAPDECYFATLLSMKGRNMRQHVANRATTWKRFDPAKSHPQEYSEISLSAVAQIAESGCFFARKFSPDSDIGHFGLHLELRKRAALSLRPFQKPPTQHYIAPSQVGQPIV